MEVKEQMKLEYIHTTFTLKTIFLLFIYSAAFFPFLHMWTWQTVFISSIPRGLLIFLARRYGVSVYSASPSLSHYQLSRAYICMACARLGSVWHALALWGDLVAVWTRTMRAAYVLLLVALACCLAPATATNCTSDAQCTTFNEYCSSGTCTPTGTSGDACCKDVQCNSASYFCSTGSNCGGVCTIFLAPGASCVRNAQCGILSACTGGTCTNPVQGITQIIQIAIGVSVAAFVLCCVIIPVGICFCFGMACFAGAKSANGGGGTAGRVL